MKKILKRNQVMITSLAIMIAIAGYLSFAGNKLSDEALLETGKQEDLAVTGEYTYSDQMKLEDTADENLSGALEISDEDIEQAATITDIESLDSDIDTLTPNYLDEGMAEALPEATVDEIPGEAVFTNTTGVNTFSGAKLLKEQTRAKNKETLLEIIDNTNIAELQKEEAIKNMIELTDIAERETSAEILLGAKGFGDVVVSISNNMVDVMINATTLTDAQRAQIEDIVKRKTEISGENIIITPVGAK